MASPAVGMISPIRKRLHQRNRNFGFTLLELIFVAAILIFIATVAIPQFRKSFNFLGLQNFVSDVVSFARYAQAKAIVDGKTKRLMFDVEGKLLRIESYDVVKKEDEVEIEDWSLEKSKPIPDFIILTDLQQYSENGIKFYPDGTADKATIKITISSGKSYTISVEQATGYVKVEEPLQ